MKKLITLLLFLASTAFAAEGFQIRGYCSAYTRCPNLGRYAHCQIQAPCSWRVMPYQAVECTGFDVFYNLIVIHNSCYGTMK